MRNICILFLIGMMFFGCDGSTPPPAPTLDVPRQFLNDPQMTRSGAELFVRYCRECHGTLGEGRNPRAAKFEPPAPDFLNPSYTERDPAYLFWRISRGKSVEPFFSQGSAMPVFEPHLTEKQIWQLVAYLRQRAVGR